MRQICVVCAAEKDLTIDHIIPLSRGGTNEITNLQVLCRKCNSKKHDKTMEEFLMSLKLE
ncbi:MAG: HNH endonuclease [Clostridia bacterium]